MTTLLEKVQSLHNYLSINSTTVDALLVQGIDKLISREQQRLLKLQAAPSDELLQFERCYLLDLIRIHNNFKLHLN